MVLPIDDGDSGPVGISRRLNAQIALVALSKLHHALICFPMLGMVHVGVDGCEIDRVVGRLRRLRDEWHDSILFVSTCACGHVCKCADADEVIEAVIEYALQRRTTQVITNKLRPRITASCTQTRTSRSAWTPRGGAPGMRPRSAGMEKIIAASAPVIGGWRGRTPRKTSMPIVSPLKPINAIAA